MKKNLHYISAVLILISGSACKKDSYELKATASVTVVNAIIDGGAVRVNAGADNTFTYARAIDLPYLSSSVYGAFVGSNTVTAVKATDTTKVLFRRVIDLQPINTLYLSGQYPNVDTTYRVETNFPYIQSYGTSPDNSSYIRFVNLSPNSSPLNINIQSATTNEASALAYRGITTFKKYAALTTTASYIFEIRDSGTNAILATVTLAPNNIRYKTVSIIIRGLQGTTTGTNTFGTIQVNYT